MHLRQNTMVGGDLSLKDQVQVQVLYSHLCVFTVMIFEVIAIKRKKKKKGSEIDLKLHS